jgi:hypothetical protein
VLGPPAPAIVIDRFVAPGLLVVIALVHLNLYVREHYREIPTVGWLFLLTVLSAAALATSLIVRPGWMTEASAALFALGVLVGYGLTLWLPEGLFGFKEPSVSFSGVISIVAELAAAFVLGISLHRHRRLLRAPHPVVSTAS